MANLKISDLTPKGAPIDPTDLFEVSVFNGIDYDTFSVSGADFPSGGGGGGFFGNETATVDSTKDFATFSMQWIGLGEFYAEATNAPTVGNASFEFAGFGVGGGDVIFRESNGAGATIRESYGDLTQRFFGGVGIGNAPVPSVFALRVDASSFASSYAGFFTGSTFGVLSSGNPFSNFYSQGNASARGYYYEGAGGATGVTKVGYLASDFGINTGGVNTAFSASVLDSSTAENEGIRLDVRNSTTSNLAIRWLNGDIKMPSGNLGFTGSGTYTNFVIEKGIITSAS